MCLLKKRHAFIWEDLSEFKFEYTTGNMSYAEVCFKLMLEDGAYKASYKKSGVPDEKAEVFTVDSDFAVRLGALLNSYGVEKWDGFKKSDKRVLDGRSFHIYIRNLKGQRIGASGYMKWPKNYNEVKKALTELFDSI